MTRDLLKWLSVLLFALLMPVTGQAQTACQLPAGLQPISLCRNDAGNAVIGPSGGANCTRVFVDRSLTGASALKKLTIEAGGEVYFPDESLEVNVETIEVSGLFQAGTAAASIDELDLPDGSPDFTKYFYDSARGLLFSMWPKNCPMPSVLPLWAVAPARRMMMPTVVIWPGGG